VTKGIGVGMLWIVRLRPVGRVASCDVEVGVPDGAVCSRISRRTAAYASSRRGSKMV